MRKNAREAVYKLLFSNLFNDKFDDDFKNFIFEEEGLSDEDKVFANQLIDAYYMHESEINAKNRSESIRKSKKSFWERWF